MEHHDILPHDYPPVAEPPTRERLRIARRALMNHDATAAQAEQERDKWDRLGKLAGTVDRKLACKVEAARWDAIYRTERRTAARLLAFVGDLERAMRYRRA